MYRVLARLQGNARTVVSQFCHDLCVFPFECTLFRGNECWASYEFPPHPEAELFAMELLGRLHKHNIECLLINP